MRMDDQEQSQHVEDVHGSSGGEFIYRAHPRLLKRLLEASIYKITHLNATREFSYDPLSALGGAQCTWLLTEIGEDTGLAFGLCDLGLGCPD
jgi:hypothetical protein